MNKLIGWAVSFFAKKADLYSGTPENGKPWYKSKVILSGIVVMILGVYPEISNLLVQAGHTPLPEIPTFIFVILGGLGIYGRIDSNKPITLSGNKNPAIK